MKTRKEVAQEYGVHVNSVYNWGKKSGAETTIKKFGKKPLLVYDEEKLKEFLEVNSPEEYKKRRFEQWQNQ